jgi:hypothetical protein
MDNALKLFRGAYLNNKGYKLNHSKNKKYFVLRHANSGAYLLVNYNNHRMKIVEGETPIGNSGKGIGTKLRALVTVLSNMTGLPTTQIGMWFVSKRPNNKNNRPPTTRILRNKLEWRPLLQSNGTNMYRSIFDPKKNNASLARTVLSK